MEAGENARRQGVALSWRCVTALGHGDPQVVTVGLPDVAVKESKDHVYAIRTLRQAADFLDGKIQLTPCYVDVIRIFSEIKAHEDDYEDVKGQPPSQGCYGVPGEQAKRAIEVAVAGGHNILMLGPLGMVLKTNVIMRAA